MGIAKRINKIPVRTAIVAIGPDCRKLAYLHKELSNFLGLKQVEIFSSREAALNWLQSS